MYQHDRNVPLSWQELFDICHYYRQMQHVLETDVVVLLTCRPN